MVTKWSKLANCQEILIVDDMLGQDPFMVSIYKMAAPSGIEVDIKSAADAGLAFKADELGSKNIFALFKNIQMARKAYDAGFDLKKLQLGGVPAENGRKTIFQAVALGPEDVEDLNHLYDAGVEIELQVVPEEAGMSYEDAMRKYVA